MRENNMDLKSIASTPYAQLMGWQNDNTGNDDASSNVDTDNTFRLADEADLQAQPQLTSRRQGNVKLDPYGQSILDRYDHASIEPADETLTSEMKKFRPTLVNILSQYGTMEKIKNAPPNTRAALYALTQLGNTSYGRQGTVTDPQIPKIGGGNYKCNVFASKCWSRGAGINYNVGNQNGMGYPTYESGLPPTANDIYTNAYNMKNFTHTKKPKTGDIFAFAGGRDQMGHSGIYLGGDLVIYAGENDVKLGTLPYIKEDDGYLVSPRFRTYTPGH